MIDFACSHCGVKMKVKTQFAGKRGTCPTCKQSLVVPAAEAMPAFLPQGEIDGTGSSLHQSGVQADITLEGRDAKARPGQKPVRELLAQQTRKGRRYVLADEIGRGGMGAVLRAVDCDIRREVAIKFLIGQADAKNKARFVEEAQITGQLEHPNIPPVHEVGIDSQGRLYFSMKMVKGRSLAQVLDELRKNPRAAEKEWPLARLLNVIVNICNGLAYAHSRGVIHRDLKPANVMIGDFGEVYVMDWGLAKVLASGVAPAPRDAANQELPRDADATPLATSSKVLVSREPDVDMTQQGAVLGTPAYMPPEQATGNISAIDQRSDIYSLGAILYELLTLLPPVDKEGGYLAVLMRVANGEIVPPEQRLAATRRGTLPPELSAIAMKALSKEQKDRYPNVESLRKDIERFQEGRSVSAKEDTKREMIWKFVKRNKGFSAGMAATLLVMLCSMWFLGEAWLETRQALAKQRKADQARLDQGRDSVPAFIRAGRLAVKERQFDDALKQARIGVEFDPENPEARLFKGQMLIVHQRFGDAQAELEKFRELRPGDGTVERLWKLCRQARPSDATTRLAFADVFNEQKEYGLADGMTRDIAPSDLEARKKLLVMYRQRIEEAWPGLGKLLELDASGKFSLKFHECRQVRDLSPLQGMPLVSLDLFNCGGVRDLSPLRGMPLVSLDLFNCGGVRDLSPLRGMPLVSLDLFNCGGVRDVSPLEEANLSEIKGLPPAVDKGMSVLRRMKTLGRINQMPAAEFWKQYDSGKYPQYKD